MLLAKRVCNHAGHATAAAGGSGRRPKSIPPGRDTHGLVARALSRESSAPSRAGVQGAGRPPSTQTPRPRGTAAASAPRLLSHRVCRQARLQALPKLGPGICSSRRRPPVDAARWLLRAPLPWAPRLMGRSTAGASSRSPRGWPAWACQPRCRRASNGTQWTEVRGLWPSASGDLVFGGTFPVLAMGHMRGAASLRPSQPLPRCHCLTSRAPCNLGR